MTNKPQPSAASQVPPGEPPAPLQIALEKASADPGARPAFYRLLLQSDVWIPGQAAEDGTLELQHWEKQDANQVIPFFTSEQALRHSAAPQSPFVRLPARTLFSLTRGETLFLNPRLAQGKEFTPQEIRQLLAGDLTRSAAQTILQGGVPLLLSALESPPAAMIDALNARFREIKIVKQAFICQVKDQPDQPGNLLIGIEADGDIQPIIQTIGDTASGWLLENEAIDICQIQHNDPGVSHFMLAHIPPFYQRRWGSFLREFQGKTK